MFAFYSASSPDNFKVPFRFSPERTAYDLGTVPSGVTSVQFNVRGAAALRCSHDAPTCA